MRPNREKEVNALRAFIDGVFGTTVVFLIVFMVLDFKLQEAAWIGMLGSILVALLTITAAWFALAGNRAQIRQAGDFEDDRKRNSLIAARAVLPAVTSEMILIAQNNLGLCFEPGHEPIGNDLPPAEELMSLRSDLLPPLKECIEHADEISQERMANVLRHFQVQQARSRSKKSERLTPTWDVVDFTVPMHNAISNAIGWAVIHALVGDMFGYARGRVSSIPTRLDPDNVRGAFVFAGITVEQFANLNMILEERIKRGGLENDWAA